MKKKSENAYFIQRFAAFVLDTFFIVLIASLFTIPFVDSDAVTKLNESSSEVVEKYTNQEISTKVYFNEAMDISYQMAKQNGVVTLVTLLFSILYFIVFQFYKGGQTIGKKLLRIKVVSDDEKELTMNQVVIRSLIIDSILLDMIMFAFVIFGTSDVYAMASLCFELIQYVIIFASAFMIMYGKLGQGVHDKIAHTKVIRVG